MTLSKTTSLSLSLSLSLLTLDTLAHSAPLWETESENSHICIGFLRVLFRAGNLLLRRTAMKYTTEYALVLSLSPSLYLSVQPVAHLDCPSCFCRLSKSDNGKRGGEECRKVAQIQWKCNSPSMLLSPRRRHVQSSTQVTAQRWGLSLQITIQGWTKEMEFSWEKVSKVFSFFHPR